MSRSNRGEYGRREDDSRATNNTDALSVIMTPVFSMDSSWFWGSPSRPDASSHHSSEYGYDSSEEDEDYSVNDYSSVGDATGYSSVFGGDSAAETAERSVVLSIGRTETEGDDTTFNCNNESKGKGWRLQNRSRSGISSVVNARDLRSTPSNEEDNSIAVSHKSYRSATASPLSKTQYNVRPNGSGPIVPEDSFIAGLFTGSNKTKGGSSTAADKVATVEKHAGPKIEPTSYNTMVIAPSESALSRLNSDDATAEVRGADKRSVADSKTATATRFGKCTFSVIPLIASGIMASEASRTQRSKLRALKGGGPSISSVPKVVPRKVDVTAIDDDEESLEGKRSALVDKILGINSSGSLEDGVSEGFKNNTGTSVRTIGQRDFKIVDTTAKKPFSFGNAFKSKKPNSGGSVGEESYIQGYELELLDLKDCKRQPGKKYQPTIKISEKTREKNKSKRKLQGLKAFFHLESAQDRTKEFTKAPQDMAEDVRDETEDGLFEEEVKFAPNVSVRKFNRGGHGEQPPDRKTATNETTFGPRMILRRTPSIPSVLPKPHTISTRAAMIRSHKREGTSPNIQPSDWTEEQNQFSVPTSEPDSKPNRSIANSTMLALKTPPNKNEKTRQWWSIGAPESSRQDQGPTSPEKNSTDKGSTRSLDSSSKPRNASDPTARKVVAAGITAALSAPIRSILKSNGATNATTDMPPRDSTIPPEAEQQTFKERKRFLCLKAMEKEDAIVDAGIPRKAALNESHLSSRVSTRTRPSVVQPIEKGTEVMMNGKTTFDNVSTHSQTSRNICLLSKASLQSDATEKRHNLGILKNSNDNRHVCSRTQRQPAGSDLRHMITQIKAEKIMEANNGKMEGFFPDNKGTTTFMTVAQERRMLHNMKLAVNKRLEEIERKERGKFVRSDSPVYHTHAAICAEAMFNHTSE